MKKLISILSVALASVLMQNCSYRDEDLNAEDVQSGTTNKILIMRGDSFKTSGGPVNTKPPVRDGDNWRFILDK